MFTQEQYDREYARYKDAPMEVLKLINRTLQFNLYLSETQMARLAAARDLLPIRRAAMAREYARTRSANLKLTSV